MPDADRYAEEILPIVEARCGGCHTTPAQFGAPFSLLDYDTITAGKVGERITDRMVIQLGAGNMPPPGNIRPTPDEHASIVDWASCGENTPAYPSGLRSNRPIFDADDQPPAGTERIELTAQEFTVPDGTADLYQNFPFANIVASDKFVRRFDIKIDESRVVHHITLHHANGSDYYLYAWAPGTGAMEFPDGGLRIRPTDQFRLEIHYNNISGEGDAVDSSGIVLFVDEPIGNEYAMLDPHTNSIFIPAGSVGEAHVDCTAGDDFTILAALPHMHGIGDSYRHTLQRVDGTIESIIELTDWSFYSQFFYDIGVQVNAGDTMRIVCNYFNDRDGSVHGGTGTTDEMCYDFLYVTPATASLDCQ